MAKRTWITDEQWSAVKGYEGSYEVSDQGRVRSLDRLNVNTNGVARTLRGKMLRLSCDSEGYCQVGLLRNGCEIKVRVHRLVAEAFIVNPRRLPIVDHRDRVRTHNGVGNLRWASFSDNRRNMTRLAEAELVA